MSNDMLKHKTYLAVGYEEKAQAQQEIGRLNNGVAGISFDGEQGLWYAKAGADKHKVAPWLPDPRLCSINIKIVTPWWNLPTSWRVRA